MIKVTRREALAALAGLAVTGVTGTVQAADGYRDVSPPQRPIRTDGKIEVLEFFWYGCPHCYQFHPILEQWKKTLADDVAFIPVAAALNPGWVNHARAYFAAESLGVVDKIHDSLFNAIHKDKKRIIKLDDLADFGEKQGIDRDKYYKTMTSFAVESKLRRSQQLAQAYQINGVPSVTVAGKYVTSGSLAGSYPRAIEIINQLIARERTSA